MGYYHMPVNSNGNIQKPAPCWSQTNHQPQERTNNLTISVQISHRTLGNSKLRIDWQRRTMLTEFVWKSFIKNRPIAKSRDDLSGFEPIKQQYTCYPLVSKNSKRVEEPV